MSDLKNEIAALDRAETSLLMVPKAPRSVRHRLDPRHEDAMARGGRSSGFCRNLCGTRAKKILPKHGDWQPNWTTRDDDVNCRECRARIAAGHDARAFTFAANNPYKTS